MPGCKQGEGDICQVNDDCEEGLDCNAGTMRCQRPGAEVPDAAPIILDAAPDAGPADASVDANVPPVDAGVDAQVI